MKYDIIYKFIIFFFIFCVALSYALENAIVSLQLLKRKASPCRNPMPHTIYNLAFYYQSKLAQNQSFEKPITPTYTSKICFPFLTIYVKHIGQVKSRDFLVDQDSRHQFILIICLYYVVYILCHPKPSNMIIFVS